MNSDKAAAVRDSVNGCPAILDTEPSSGADEERRPRELTLPNEEGDVYSCGERVDEGKAHFRPAYVEEVGKMGNGDGAKRPVYVVVLEPIWTEKPDHDGYASLSPELVYEIAKHDCRIRFYPAEHRHGPAVWVCDHWSHDLSETDGERCEECDSTYFKIKDGAPECARCGWRGSAGNVPEPEHPKISDFAGGDNS